MKISIITTVYKAEQTLSHLLDSMMAQESEELEFFLINNGTQDRSGEICAQYAEKDSRFHICTLKNNIGYIAARNLGIQQCEGDYIGFCDSDDYLEPKGYDKAIEIIKATDCDFYMTAWNTVLPTMTRRHQLPYKTGLYTGDSVHERILPQAFGVLPGKGMLHGFAWKEIIRRDIVVKNNIRFIPVLQPFEDQVFNIQVLKNVRGVYVDDYPLYNYVVSEQSITGRMFKKDGFQRMFDRYIMLYSEKENQADTNTESTANCNSVVNSMYEILVNQVKYDPDYKKHISVMSEQLGSRKLRDICVRASYGVSRYNDLIKWCIVHRLPKLILYMAYYAMKIRGKT